MDAAPVPADREKEPQPERCVEPVSVQLRRRAAAARRLVGGDPWPRQYSRDSA
ncbi:hypothetical protein [Nocardia farcinica]|uniref:hypothetical protein n=1 Tax=Nocardia farcinica TaxID=37329 RepID=UPI000C005293|nr:hypothetical protein [Nocardia farcinica]PFW98164.1 hypothetical protein CJ468_06497 [Nocardia farcinica]